MRIQTKSTPILNKNEILDEFNNLHKIKFLEISSNKNNNSKSGGDSENKLKSLTGKMPSVNKSINCSYKSLNNSEPRKIISSSFRKLKAGITYTGSLYNNRMESKLRFTI